MNDAKKYGITVRFGVYDGDECFEARIAELPNVAEYADSFEEAYELALDTIATTAVMLAEQGRSMPAPAQPADDYSGRVTLRLPKSLHRGLACKAENEGVSLNSMLVSVLSAFRGFDAALTETNDEWHTMCTPEKKTILGAGSKVVPIGQYAKTGAWQ